MRLVRGQLFCFILENLINLSYRTYYSISLTTQFQGRPESLWWFCDHSNCNDVDIWITVSVDLDLNI